MGGQLGNNHRYQVTPIKGSGDVQLTIETKIDGEWVELAEHTQPFSRMADVYTYVNSVEDDLSVDLSPVTVITMERSNYNRPAFYAFNHA